jgi:fatty acid-binding protein DegV
MEFPGADLVRQIPVPISIVNNSNIDTSFKGIDALPNNINSGNLPIIFPPSSKQLIQLLIDSRNEFEELFILLPSRFLSPIYSQIKNILQVLPENSKYHLIDSGTFSYGLGMMVSKVAEEINKGKSNSSVAQNIRLIIPHIFGIFCCPNLTYAQQSKFLDIPQSIALDFIGTIPLFTMEDGKFSPLTKINKKKYLLVCFEDFIDEFEQPQEIIVVSGNSSKPKEVISLQTHCNEQFQNTKFSFQSINTANASIIGPKALGIFVLDKFI